MFEMTRETDSFKDESLQSVRWMAQDDEIRIISGTYHKLGYGEHILFAPISKSSWLCQAVISKSIFGADDVAFFLYLLPPFRAHKSTVCQGIIINRSGTYWIDYPSLCFALVAQLYHIDLASWLVQERRPSLVRSIASSSICCWRRFPRPEPGFGVVLLSGVLNSRSGYNCQVILTWHSAST